MKDRCESCGLEICSPEEHGAKNPAIPYCRNCTHEDGTLKDKRFVRNGWLQHLINCGMSRTEAESAVDKEMAKMPAWKQ